MANKLYKYYVFITLGVVDYYLSLDSNNNLVTTTTKTPLVFAPKGWRDQALRWDRAFVYHAIFQAYTVPLKFVKDGAKLLRVIYRHFGVNPMPEVKLLIEQFDDSIGAQNYDTYYIGDFDFSRYDRENDYVTVEIMEGGFMGKLKAKEDTDIEIPVESNSNKVWVHMDGLMVLAAFLFTGLDQPVDNSPVTFMKSSRENYPTFLWFKTDGYSNGDNNPKGNDYIGPNATPFNVNYAGADMISLATRDKYIIHNTSTSVAYDYRLKGSLRIEHQNTVGSPRDTTMYLYVCNAGQPGTTVSKYVLASGGTIPGLGSLSETIEFDYQITLQPNEQAWVWFRHTGTPGEVKFHIYGADLSIEVPNRVKEGYIQALRPIDVFKSVISEIDSTAIAESDLLENTVDCRTKVITSGDVLRSLAGGVIKTTPTEFYRAMNAQFFTALKFDRPTNTVSIVPKEEAFDDSIVILDIGEVSNFHMKPLTEEMFAKYTIGQRDINYDDVNGKDDPNTTLEFQSPLTRITTQKDMRNPYRVDPTGIELTRGNFTEKTQANSDSDNDVFVIDIEDTPFGTIPAGFPGAGEPYYRLQRSGYSIIQGLFSPYTMFNIFLSPKYRGILKQGRYINSVLYPMYNLPGQKLKFMSASKTPDNNNYLIWWDGFNNIDERADEPLANLGAPLFYSTIFEFDCMIPKNIYAALTTNPYGKIRFTSKGKEGFGFLLSVQDEPVTTPKQTYRLLCAPSTDLSNFD